MKPEESDYNYDADDLLTVKEVMEICKDVFKFSGDTYFYQNLRDRFKFRYYSFKIIDIGEGKKAQKPTVKRLPFKEVISTIQKIKNNPIWTEE